MLGRYADRSGRKAALTLSVMLMCLGSLLIAFAPAYAHVGLAAPLTLIFARLLQGFSVGGEYGTSATYMSEVTPAHQRGFYSGVLYVTLVMGQLLSLAVLLVLQWAFLSSRSAGSLGLAHSVRDRRVGGARRLVSAAQSARDATFQKLRASGARSGEVGCCCTPCAKC